MSRFGEKNQTQTIRHLASLVALKTDPTDPTGQQQLNPESIDNHQAPAADNKEEDRQGSIQLRMQIAMDCHMT